MKAHNIINPANPELLDDAFINLNAKLLTQINWLTNVFGKAQKLTKPKGNQKITYPAIFTGIGKEYESMLPNEEFGNFSFWEAKDYDIDWIDNQFQIIDAEVSFTVWMNLNNVLNSDELRNLENVKVQLLDFFTKVRVPNTRFQVTGISEDNSKIYERYSINEIKQQYLMHPFAGLKFYGNIRYERMCV